VNQACVSNLVYNINFGLGCFDFSFSLRVGLSCASACSSSFEKGMLGMSQRKIDSKKFVGWKRWDSNESRQLLWAQVLESN